MGLSPEIRDHATSLDSIRPQVASSINAGGTFFESIISEAINPKTLNIEDFWKLDGIIQETVLISLLKTNDKIKINELRPDFEIERQISYDEKRMASWTSQITKRETPITAPKFDIDDGLFAQIHHTVYSMDKAELAEILERERQRRQKFTPGLFAPAEDIKGFKAAIRYRQMLENKIEKEEKSLKKWPNPGNP